MLARSHFPRGSGTIGKRGRLRGCSARRTRAATEGKERQLRTVLLIIAALLIFFGALFFLQGIGLVGGSGMTGNRSWAVIGPIMVVAGIVLGIFSWRRRGTSA